MYSVLRVFGNEIVLRELVEKANSVNSLFNAAVNRQGHFVAALSKETLDWKKHQQEIFSAMEQLLPILKKYKNQFNKIVVDSGVDIPQQNRDIFAISFSVYDFPPQLLALLGNNGIFFEITIS